MFEYLRDVKKWRCDMDGRVYGTKGKPIGYKNKSGYVKACAKFDKKHRFIWVHRFVFWFFHGYVPLEVDHKSKIRDDNRLANLRPVNHEQNQQQKIGIGAYKTSNGRWRAQIKISGKTVYLGTFDLFEDARARYLEAKKKNHLLP